VGHDLRHDFRRKLYACGIGAARDFSTPLGLTAAWNLSKVRLYALANDFVVWANAIKALVPSNSFVSPGNLGQVGIFSCTDFVVDDCDFAMIARSAIVMGSSTNVLVNRCRFRFVMQGIIDNSRLQQPDHGQFD
jgi:hypothetical protein